MAVAFQVSAFAARNQQHLGVGFESHYAIHHLHAHSFEQFDGGGLSLAAAMLAARLVAALTDDKVLLMISCEAGAYNTIWLAWLVSRQQPYVARQVRLTLPFQPPGNAARDIELINASIDERRHELVTLDKGRGPGDCGVQTRWRYDGQRFSLVRYAQQPQCDNWQGPDAWPTLWITR